MADAFQRRCRGFRTILLLDMNKNEELDDGEVTVLVAKSIVKQSPIPILGKRNGSDEWEVIGRAVTITISPYPLFGGYE